MADIALVTGAGSGLGAVIAERLAREGLTVAVNTRARTEEADAVVAAIRAGGGHAFAVRSPSGGEYDVRLVASEAGAYDRFYNIFANPILWFIQHYLWDLSNAPDIRRNEIEAFEYGYNVVNEDLAQAVIEEIDERPQPIVMVHDYHLYTLPALVRRARPDVFLHHFVLALPRHRNCGHMRVAAQPVLILGAASKLNHFQRAAKIHVQALLLGFAIQRSSAMQN